MTVNVVDKDPRVGSYNFVFSFGELQDKDGAILSAYHYEVWGVDANGRFLGAASSKIGQVAVLRNKNPDPSCCKGNKFRVATQGTFSGDMAGLKRFAIRPVSVNAATLPFVTYTNELVDVTTGQVQNISGNFKLTMSSADVANIQAYPETFKAVFAESFAKSAGVSADDVTITQIYVDDVPQLRRLLDLDSAGLRRLSTAVVRVDYQIVTTDTSIVIDTSTISKEALKTAIEEAAAEQGFTITVTVTEIPAPTVTRVGVVGQGSDALKRFISAFVALLALGAHILQ